MKTISPQSALPQIVFLHGKIREYFLHPEIPWLRWAVINFACLETIFLLLISEGSPWSNVWVYLVHYYFYWYLSRTTDQTPSVSLLTVPRWCFKEPGEQVAISPLPNSNVNSFCQQIKVDLLAVSWALIPSILLASVILSEAVIIPCHFLFHAWEAPGLELSAWRLLFLMQV